MSETKQRSWEGAPEPSPVLLFCFLHSVNGWLQNCGLLVVSLSGLQLLQSVMLKMNQLRTQCSVFLRDPWVRSDRVVVPWLCFWSTLSVSVSCCIVRAEHPPGAAGFRAECQISVCRSSMSPLGFSCITPNISSNEPPFGRGEFSPFCL